MLIASADRKSLSLYFLLSQSMQLDRLVDWRSICAMPYEGYTSIQCMHLLGDDRLVLVVISRLITHVFVTDIACTKLLSRRSIDNGEVLFSCVTYDGWFIFGKRERLRQRLHFIQLLGEEEKRFSCAFPTAARQVTAIQICNDGTLVLAHAHGLLISDAT